ncbi:MAG: hypothetical protein IIA54_04160, partial [Chloroflexi bacterium]|nr:hypothetical protein [Chloroflexota bacterium]
MSKRMTIVFDDDQLYTALKVEAVRTGRHAKDIVAEAVREWIESAEDAELTALAGHGKVMGQRALSLAQLRKMGAKGRQLRRQYMNDGYVAAGYAGQGFALREERIKGQDKPPRLLYPTRILGGALWQQSSIWPPRGSFELF